MGQRGFDMTRFKLGENRVIALIIAALILLVIWSWIWKGFDKQILTLSIASGLLGTILVYFTLPKISRKTLVLFAILLIQVFQVSLTEKRAIKKLFEAEKYIYSGDYLYNKNDFASSIEQYKRAQEIDPNNLNIQRKIANTYWNLGEIDKSIETQASVLSNPRSSIKDKYELGLYYFLKFHQLFTSSASVKKPGELIAWSPEPYLSAKYYIEGNDKIGPVIFIVDRNGMPKLLGQRQLDSRARFISTQCENIIQEIIKVDKENYECHLLLYQLYAMNGLYENALIEAKKCLLLKPTSLASYQNLIFIYCQLLIEPMASAKNKGITIVGPDPNKYLKEIDNTIALAHKIFPQYTRGYQYLITSSVGLFYMGYIRTQEELANKVLIYANMIKRTDPKDIYGSYFLGFGYLLLSDYEEAILNYDAALGMNPESSIESDIRAYRGIALSALGKQKEADSEFKRALKLNPNNELALQQKKPGKPVN
jgi:tetratricopeptide (TPR) repeat protein